MQMLWDIRYYRLCDKNLPCHYSLIIKHVSQRQDSASLWGLTIVFITVAACNGSILYSYSSIISCFAYLILALEFTLDETGLKARNEHWAFNEYLICAMITAPSVMKLCTRWCLRFSKSIRQSIPSFSILYTREYYK